ncbi:hypothetical protein BS17DRAFT_770438 [Gyrodon lividus]|nr:hypothetical protein BS17DRAFT_770438 [Gyrodon lividus]
MTRIMLYIVFGTAMSYPVQNIVYNTVNASNGAYNIPQNINATQQRTYNNPHQAHVPQEHVQPPCQHQQPLQSQNQYQNPWTLAGVQQQYHMPAGGATGKVAPYQVQSPPVATPQLLQSDLTNE